MAEFIGKTPDAVYLASAPTAKVKAAMASQTQAVTGTKYSTSKRYCYMLQKDSPWLPAVNAAITHLYEADAFDNLVRMYVEMEESKITAPQSNIKFAHLWKFTSWFYAGGIASSAIVLFLERLLNYVLFFYY